MFGVIPIVVVCGTTRRDLKVKRCTDNHIIHKDMYIASPAHIRNIYTYVFKLGHRPLQRA